MRNPILSGLGYRFYSLVWVVIILAQGFVLSYYGFSMEIAFLDSLVYNLLFAAIVPGFWYIVVFASLNKDDLSVVGTHIVAATITIGAWSLLPGYVLALIFADEIEYLQFVDESYLWRVIIGLMFYCITILVFYLIKYYHDIQGKVNRELELQSLLQDAELRMLKSQINPHFIFNSLNSISALTATKPDSAREMLIKLSDFLRYSLGKDSVQMNSLEQEIRNVNLYLDIEKVRFGKKLNFDQNIDDACLSAQVPNLILQPLVENAIKYGLYESVGEVTISLNCRRNDEMLEVTVSNNYDPESMPEKGEGIGLENVNKRLELVFNRSDLLEVHRKETQFSVTIYIPLNQH